MIRKFFCILATLAIISLMAACGPAQSTNVPQEIDDTAGTTTKETEPVIPSIDSTATSVVPNGVAASSTPETAGLPMPWGDVVPHSADTDKLVNELTSLMGLPASTYEVYQLPDSTPWEDTLAYYDTQAAAAGWGDTHKRVGEFFGGNYAFWTTGTGTTAQYFVVLQVDNTDQGSITLNIFNK